MRPRRVRKNGVHPAARERLEERIGDGSIEQAFARYARYAR
jgi:hypothetical protein